METVRQPQKTATCQNSRSGRNCAIWHITIPVRMPSQHPCLGICCSLYLESLFSTQQNWTSQLRLHFLQEAPLDSQYPITQSLCCISLLWPLIQCRTLSLHESASFVRLWIRRSQGTHSYHCPQDSQRACYRPFHQSQNFVTFLWDRVSLCSSGRPQTGASAFWVLGL
jgi:hypothetical protein